jgi:outer membrane immunogenic protein
MKAVLLASSIVLGFALASGSASAADIYPLKAPPPPFYPWSGCYIDGGLGYGMWNIDHYDEIETAGGPWTATSATSTSGGRGWLGRVGAGCDYQVNSSWVIGVFGDYDFMNLNGVMQAGNVTPVVGNVDEDNAWAVGARIGYLITPKLMGYIDGGYTQTHFDQINLDFDVVGSPSAGLALPAQTYKGWFLGGGYEYGLWDIVPIKGLFWRTEYRFSQYNGADLAAFFTSTGAPFCGAAGGIFAAAAPTVCGGEHMQPYVQTVTTGIVWKFNFGGPMPW